MGPRQSECLTHEEKRILSNSDRCRDLIGRCDRCAEVADIIYTLSLSLSDPLESCCNTKDALRECGSVLSLVAMQDYI